MAQTTISLRMDERLKIDFAALTDDLGMSMTTAFTVFARQAVREGRIPFVIGQPDYSAETKAAFVEGRRMIAAPTTRYYDNAEDLFKAEGIEL